MTSQRLLLKGHLTQTPSALIPQVSFLFEIVSGKWHIDLFYFSPISGLWQPTSSSTSSYLQISFSSMLGINFVNCGHRITLHSYKWISFPLLFLALTSVLTQGSGSAWVTSYKVTWSLDASVWTSILDDFNVEVTFSGNSDASSQVENDLPYGLLATHLRVNPQTWQDFIAMRIDVYGCSFSGLYCDYWDDVISRHTVENCL